jgi:peptidoglycan/LPS O-acetylase OafA/YrhL
MIFKPYLNELDGIRAIAALMVMFSHFTPYWPQETPGSFINHIAVIGQSGVSLFFALSGFLITRILIATKTDEHYFKNFYLRRTLRIFPLYYGFLVFYYWVYPFLIHQPLTPFSAQVPYWLYFQDFTLTFFREMSGPSGFWSLAIEEHFYLLWPAIIYFIPIRKIPWAVAGAIVVSVLTRIFLAASDHEVFYFTFSRTDELSLGALMAYLQFGSPNKRRAVYCFTGFIAGMVAILALWSLSSGDAISSVQVIKYCIVAVTLSSLIGFCVSLSNGNLIKRMLQSKPLAYTGKISYGLYVFHPVCFELYDVYVSKGSLIVDFILSFGFTFLIASLSYKYFESYFLRLKKRFSYKASLQPSTRKREIAVARIHFKN